MSNLMGKVLDSVGVSVAGERGHCCKLCSVAGVERSSFCHMRNGTLFTRESQNELTWHSLDD